jgi:hypothetical protein
MMNTIRNAILHDLSIMILPCLINKLPYQRIVILLIILILLEFNPITLTITTNALHDLIIQNPYGD